MGFGRGDCFDALAVRVGLLVGPRPNTTSNLPDLRALRDERLSDLSDRVPGIRGPRTQLLHGEPVGLRVALDSGDLAHVLFVDALVATLAETYFGGAQERLTTKGSNE